LFGHFSLESNLNPRYFASVFDAMTCLPDEEGCSSRSECKFHSAVLFVRNFPFLSLGAPHANRGLEIMYGVDFYG